MRYHIRTICLLICFTSALASYGQYRSRKQITAFEAEAADLQKKLQIPGLSFAIVKDQKLVYATGMGWADVENKIPATKHTLYSIASVTKTFTSVLLMQLIEQGRLDLNDAMSKYDTAFKNDSLKVVHFLTHTSEGRAGAQYRYSGDRFAFLQKVIEKITGESYQEVISENILSKARMNESVPGQDVLESNPNFKSLRKLLAKPYTLYGTNEWILSPYPPKKITASAGLLSNVVDLAKYDAALDKQLFISDATQQRAWTPFTLSSGTSAPYGLGWFIQNYKGNKIAWHYGLWPTHSAFYVKVPAQNVSLIILANSDGLTRPFSLGAGNIANSAFALAFFKHFLPSPSSMQPLIKWNADTTAFKDRITQLQKMRNDAFSEEVNAYAMITRYLLGRQSRVRTEVQIDPALYREYAGTYELLPSPLKISIAGNKLMAEGPTLNEKVELFPYAENKFFLKILNVQVEFLRNKDGVVDECMLYIDGNKFRCRKLSN